MLAVSSKRIIKQIFNEYNRLSGQKIGIPRGIGISAYLAELYMRSFDESIKSLEEVSFYARYVDDIIIVYTPKPNSDLNTFKKTLIHAIEGQGLTINEDKTKCYDLMTPSAVRLDYLGYRIFFGSGDIQLQLSNNKLEKYKKRIELTFKEYYNQSKLNEKQARKLLIKRVRFLTGNTRLKNNKKHAVVGIYFSNSLLTTTKDLKALDAYLAYQVSTLTEPVLRLRLEKMSFTKGFSDKQFSDFSTKDLAKIVKAWKYEN